VIGVSQIKTCIPSATFPSQNTSSLRHALGQQTRLD
jgi:hypothetical protein